MCGRFGFSIPRPQAEEVYSLTRAADYEPQHNIFPGTDAPVIYQPAPDERELALFRWGLVPHWAKDPKTGARMINARAETVAEKPSFRAAFKRRRCLVPANRFYEWKKLEDGKNKQPYALCVGNDEPFAMAGLWESWTSPEGKTLRTFTIITTAANSAVASIHDRMPVILAQQDYATWLQNTAEPESLVNLLAPYPAESMFAAPVQKKTLLPV